MIETSHSCKRFIQLCIFSHKSLVLSKVIIIYTDRRLSLYTGAKTLRQIFSDKYLAAYGIVNLLKKYWDNVYTAFSVGYAALLILFWDIPDFSVNCLIVYALLMIATVAIRIIMNKT